MIMALRPKIVKLAKMVGGLTGIPNAINEDAPEYYALAEVVSDEQADVALTLGLRKERTAEYAAKKCGKPVEETRRILNELSKIGVCKRFTRESDGEEIYFVQIFAPGILEMMVNNKEQLADHPIIGKAFEEYTRIRIANIAPNLPMGTGMMRVVPIETAIEGNSKTVPYEKISYYLDKYDTFSVSDCSCRKSRRVLGEGCGHLEHEMCIQMGTGAEYYIKTGRGRQITREEVEAILKKAEENGLMHQMPNIEGLGESAAICNCCSCSCFAMRVATMFEAPDAIRSNYVATVDRDSCVACGQCVENCPANALRLGQKLCAVNEIPEKPYEKVRNNVWGEEQWNVDYRINRKDVAESGTSPCKTACPAHIAVQGYIKLASQGRYREALELIKKENPFPAICGRICPRACESACTRSNIDNPIAIDEIKKFIAEQDLKEESRFVPVKRHNYHDKKIAVIGAGPAGLSCAYFLALDDYDVTVFEKEEKLGGMLTLGIPSFRLEKDVVQAEIDILKELGVTFKTGVQVGEDITLNELRKEGFKGFYIAIGAQGGRKLGISGEDSENVIAGIDFLKNINLGKDQPLSGNVVVIGGGNVAIDVARQAVRTGASNVTMYTLESREQMPALDEEINEALEENIIIENCLGPKRIISENGKVCGVEFKKCLQVKDPDGKFNPKYDEDDTVIVKADYVLLSVGQSIVWGNMLEGEDLKLGRGNTVVADDFTYETSVPDIFVGGDVYTGPKFAIDAIAAGKEGAISLHRFVQPGQSLVLGRDRREYHAFDKENIIIESYDNTPRQRATNLKNVAAQRDDRGTFTREQIIKETQRCLGCGAVVIDQYKCIGCGQCTTKCKFDAIKLEKKYEEYAPVFEKLPFEVAKYAVKRSGKIVAHKLGVD